MANQPRFHPDAPKELDRYLIPTEQIVFLLRRHWITIFEPVATMIVVLFIVGFLDRVLPNSVLILRDIVVIGWLIALARMIWLIFEWRINLFIATDRRLLLTYGIITRKVAMMPLAKVTDMRYDRTVTGKFFGYGVFILESAGQDQALSKVNFVPDPDKHYQQISAIIFAPAARRLSDKLVPSSTGSQLPISEPEAAWWRR